MHDNQDLTLARATRVLAERLRPAIHSSPHPLSLEAYRVGGEPVPVADGLAADYSPCPVGSPWGRAWDTTWFRVTGEVPAEFAGLRVEVLLDLGFDINMTGFQAEGLAYRADGSPVRSLHPRAQWIPVVREAAGGEPIEFYVEAASNPVLLDYVPFQPTESGEWETAGEELLYRIRRADVVVFETEVFELVHDCRGAAAARRAAGRHVRAPGEDPVRPRPGPGRRRPAGRRRHRGRGTRPAGRAAGQPGRAVRASDHRRRSRAHRLGLAVAAARDGAQGGPDHQLDDHPARRA